MSKVPDRTNALLQEIKKAIPEWEKITDKTVDWSGLVGDERKDHIINLITESDAEVSVAFGMLIEAVLEESE